jgi:hypothetical protein
MKRAYDRKKGDLGMYNPRDKVYFKGTNITTNRPIKKLDDKQYGLFTVIKKVGAASYKLKLPTTWKKIHPVFNKVFLSLSLQQYPSQKHPPPPLPIITNKKEEYAIEEVTDSKLSIGKVTQIKQTGPGNPKKASFQTIGLNSTRNTQVHHDKLTCKE